MDRLSPSRHFGVEFGRELHVHRLDGFVDVRGPSGADENRREDRVSHDPRHRQLHHRKAHFIGLGAELLDELEVAVLEIDVGVAGHHIEPRALRELRAVERVLACEEAGGERAVWSDADTFFHAEGEECSLGLDAVEVGGVVRAGEAVGGLGDLKARPYDRIARGYFLRNPPCRWVPAHRSMKMVSAPVGDQSSSVIGATSPMEESEPASEGTAKCSPA